jgi:enoyl-CoA hydratase/carnithine racemase
MGLADVQAALARLFTDADLRDRFFNDPIATGRTLGLAEAEANGLASLVRVDVDRFAATLRRKRVDDARKFLPLTAQALGHSFAPLLLASISDSIPPARHRDDARAFVAHLSRPEVNPPWAGDLARFELAFQEALALKFGLIVRRFRFPVGRLLEAAHLGRSLDDIRPRATLGFWLRVPGRRGVIHCLG